MKNSGWETAFRLGASGLPVLGIPSSMMGIERSGRSEPRFSAAYPFAIFPGAPVLLDPIRALFLL